MPETYAAVGISLLARKYKGTERIVTFYTLERGKVEATISGVGKPGSKLGSAAEPLTLSRLYFAQGRALDRLTQCEVIEAFYDLRRDLQRLALASYAAELVALTTEPGHPEPEAFAALEATLRNLTTCAQPELVTWAFVVRFLALQGVGLELEHCAACAAELAGDAVYDPAVGGFLCGACRRMDEGSIAASARARAALSTMRRLPVERLDRVQLAPGVPAQVRELLRRHVRYHLGADLKSEAFLQKMARVSIPHQSRSTQEKE
jgi:DNA repair protein RecO (recombination protein O)